MFVHANPQQRYLSDSYMLTAALRSCVGYSIIVISSSAAFDPMGAPSSWLQLTATSFIVLANLLFTEVQGILSFTVMCHNHAGQHLQKSANLACMIAVLQMSFSCSKCVDSYEFKQVITFPAMKHQATLQFACVC